MQFQWYYQYCLSIWFFINYFNAFGKKRVHIKFPASMLTVIISKESDFLVSWFNTFWHWQGLEDITLLLTLEGSVTDNLLFTLASATLYWSFLFFLFFLLLCQIWSNSNFSVKQLTFEKNERTLFGNTIASFFQVQQSDSMMFHSNQPVLSSTPLVSATFIISCCHCQGAIVISAIQQHTLIFLLWHHHVTADLNKAYLSIVLSLLALLLSAASSASPDSPASSFHQL